MWLAPLEKSHQKTIFLLSVKGQIIKKIEQIIENTSEKTEQKIDWTNVWGKKYPILTTYQEKVDVDDYIIKLGELLDSLKNRYGYNDLGYVGVKRYFSTRME